MPHPDPELPDTRTQPPSTPGGGDEPDSLLLVALCRRCEAARLEGTALAPADLCADRPDLLPDLLRALDVLQVMDDGPTVPSGAAEARPPRVPGYEVVGEIGRGGMGVVYSARHLALNRVVALKLMADADVASASRLVRFRQEAEAVARLQHPNIVQIFETGVTDGRPFLAMEFVDGGTLRQRTAGVPQPPRDAAGLVETVARAVHHAHAHRIVHRDLKPANILLTAAGVPKVTDFGLARSLDAGAGLTVTSDFLGTPAYAAPEQLHNRPGDIGPATDVYGLGGTLYELLAGRPPFESGSLPELLRQVADRDPVPLRRLRPECPLDLETVCQKCLDKNPARRYPSALALAEDLRRFLADEPTLARPIGPLGRVWRWAKRNPTVTGLLAAIILVLTAAAVGGAVLSASLSAALGEARRDRDRATTAERDALASEQQAREHLAAAHAAAARLALQRGNGRAALEQLDAAAAAGLDSPTLRLERVKALATVHDIPRAVDEVRALAARQDLGDLAGEVLLWQADLEMDHGSLPPDEGVAQIRRALDRGLPAAEANYARGLLAATTPVALDYFRRAVDADPASPRANGMLVTLLTLSGQFLEARDRVTRAESLFPDNPVFRVLHAMIETLTGHPDAAAGHLRQARGRLGDGPFATAEAAVAICGEVPRVALELEKVLCHDPTANPLVAFGTIHTVLARTRALRADPAADLFLPIPRALGAAFRGAPAAFAMPRPRDPVAAEAAVADLERVARVHPDGFVYLMIGVILANTETPESWSRAGAAFRRAAEAPSIFEVRRPALFGAAVAEWTQFVDSHFLTRSVRRQRTIDRMAAALEFDILPEQGHTLTVMAIDISAPSDLAWKAMASWERAAPGHPELSWQRARLSLMTGAHGMAARLADEAIARGDTDRNWPELQRVARQRLKHQADRFPALPAAPRQP